MYFVTSTNDLIKLDKHFIDEYIGSKHTRSLKGTMALIKANIPTVLEDVIENAFDRVYIENRKLKHKTFAKKGWYNYKLLIEMPVRNNDGKIISYNVYSLILVVRITNKNDLYLYDIVNIKKETGNPL